MSPAGGPAETTTGLYGHSGDCNIEALSRPDLELARHGLPGYKLCVCCFCVAVSLFRKSLFFSCRGTDLAVALSLDVFTFCQGLPTPPLTRQHIKQTYLNLPNRTPN